MASGVPKRLQQLGSSADIALWWGPAEVGTLAWRCRALYEVRYSIGNGGVEGVLCNPSGEFMPEAAAAARELGAHQAAAVLEGVLAYLPTPFPRDADERTDLVEVLDDSAWARLEELEKMWSFDEVDRVLERVVVDHPDEFWTVYDDPDAEAEALLEYISRIVGVALLGDNEAQAVLDELANWTDRRGTEEQRALVDHELRRLANLRK